MQQKKMEKQIENWGVTPPHFLRTPREVIKTGRRGRGSLSGGVPLKSANNAKRHPDSSHVAMQRETSTFVRQTCPDEYNIQNIIYLSTNYSRNIQKYIESSVKTKLK